MDPTQTTPSGEERVASSPVQVGIEWGYPISLVRRLGIAFGTAVIGLLIVDRILSEPGQELEVLIHTVPVALAVLIALYVAEVIGINVRPAPPLSFERLFWALAAACIAMSTGYALLPTYAPSPLVALGAPVVAGIAIYVHRAWVASRPIHDSEIPAVLFASSRDDATRAIAALHATPALRLQGVILPSGVDARDRLDGLEVYDVDAGFVWMREQSIRLFVVADGASNDDLRAVLAPCAGAGYTVLKATKLVANSFGRVHLGAGDDVDLISRITRRAGRFASQRLIDALVALALAPLLLVISIPVAFLVMVTSRGPAIYRQKRVGRFGEEFTIYKFRTMRQDAEKHSGPVWAQENDPRITPIGRFLRRTRIDELPQFWNVLKGDMSVVGPRPERLKFVEELREKIPFYDVRHAVRPGITGWAQIRYPYGNNLEDARRKLEYELFYISNRSASFYFAVVLETARVIFFRRGAV